eukprot:GEMP01038324.1.p1 GENE.GEMP01038324.1~~GEMP01038324.1.p1  ORF type:complete len:207 (+),score=47.73 GEMP01038324.1:153-773(+)
MTNFPATLQKALVPMGVLFVFSNLPVEAETKTVIARALFAVKSLIIIVGLGLTKWRMMYYEHKTGEKVKVEETSFVDGEMKLIAETLTTSEYDEREFVKVVGQQLVQAGIIALLHTYFMTEMPLVITSILAVVQMYESPLFRIYARGRTSADDEDLRRPFKGSMDVTGFYKKFIGLKSDKDKKAPSARSQKKEVKAKERQEKRKMT